MLQSPNRFKLGARLLQKLDPPEWAVEIVYVPADKGEWRHTVSPWSSYWYHKCIPLKNRNRIYQQCNTIRSVNSSYYQDKPWCIHCQEEMPDKITTLFRLIVLNGRLAK